MTTRVFMERVATEYTHTRDLWRMSSEGCWGEETCNSFFVMRKLDRRQTERAGHWAGCGPCESTAGHTPRGPGPGAGRSGDGPPLCGGDGKEGGDSPIFLQIRHLDLATLEYIFNRTKKHNTFITSGVSRKTRNTK